MARSRLTATSISWVQAILLSQSPTGSWDYTCPPPHQLIFVFLVDRGGVSPCCPDWTQTPGLKQSSCLSLPKCWNCKHESLRLARSCWSWGTLKLSSILSSFIYQRWGFTMLGRLVSNSWPQVIHLPRLPKVLGLQAQPGQEASHSHALHPGDHQGLSLRPDEYFWFLVRPPFLLSSLVIGLLRSSGL